MPVPPPSANVPFDLVNVAMNTARTKLNDCPLALTGNLLANTQPYAQQMYNDAWRDFQRDLAEYGEPALTEKFVSYSLPVVANIDPATEVYLGQRFYFDGQSYYTTPSVTLLPQNLICPIHVKERLAGTIQQFCEVTPCDNGLPGYPKTTYEAFWEWRSAGPGNGNAIFMPGATVQRDLEVRYAAFLPDTAMNLFVSGQWYEQPVPILRCSDILGLYVAATFAYSRGSDQAKAVANSFWADGKTAMRKLINGTTMKLRQRINHRRRPYSAGRHRGYAWW